MHEPSLFGKSSTGLDPKLIGLACYLGCFVTGLIFLAVEKESRFVKFHAMQSVIASAVIIALSIVFGFIPIIGWIGGLLLAPLSFVLWILLMVMALQGRWFKLPVIGDIAQQQAAKF